MTFGEKIAKLTFGQNRAKLSKDAGLPSNALSDYVNKKHLPRLDNARLLAVVFGVPLDWLADDALGWPPPPPGGSNLTEKELVTELGSRMAGVGRDLIEKLFRAEKTDWAAVALELLAKVKEKSEKPEPPARPPESVELASQIQALESNLRNYAPVAVVGDAPAELLKHVRPSYSYSLLDLTERCGRLYSLPGYTAMLQLALLLTMPGWPKDTIQHIVRWAERELTPPRHRNGAEKESS